MAIDGVVNKNYTYHIAIGNNCVAPTRPLNTAYLAPWVTTAVPLTGRLFGRPQLCKYYTVCTY